MNKCYLVRCTADTMGGYIGRFAGRAAPSRRIDICTTISEEQAARYDTKTVAEGVASRLARKFSGTAWEVCHVA